MATIVINGKRFDNVVGNNITVKGDKVIVDGVVIQSGLSGIVKVQFEGDVANIDATHLEVIGNINGRVDTTHLDVKGDIRGNVDTTHLKCRDIYANNIDATHINCNTKNKLGK